METIYKLFENLIPDNIEYIKKFYECSDKNLERTSYRIKLNDLIVLNETIFPNLFDKAIECENFHNNENKLITLVFCDNGEWSEMRNKLLRLNRIEKIKKLNK